MIDHQDARSQDVSRFPSLAALRLAGHQSADTAQQDGGASPQALKSAFAINDPPVHWLLRFRSFCRALETFDRQQGLRPGRDGHFPHLDIARRQIPVAIRTARYSYNLRASLKRINDLGWK